MDLPTAHNRRYVAVLALAACLILGVGWLIRPGEVPNDPVPLPTESELAQLARRAERRSLDAMTTYFAVTADDVEASITYLPATGVSGVAWNTRTIVTAPVERHEAEIVTIRSASSEDGRASLTLWGPGLPLAAVAPGGGLPGLRTARRVATLPEPGSWVLSVWRAGRERRFAPGTYLQSVSATCGVTPVQEVVSSLGLSTLMVGGGLFDIDGSLLGVILPCGDRVAAIATRSIDAILVQADTDEQRVLARYGLVLGTLAEEEMAYFKVEGGVIVREVWTGYRGDEAGLAPGDIISALGETTVASEDDLAALGAPPGDEPLALTVQRGSRTLTVTLHDDDVEADLATEADPAAGVVWDSPPRPYRIDSVISGSRAEMAGIEVGDRLVRINRAEPRNLAQVQRTFTNERALPALLEIERDNRRIAILLR